MPPDPLERLPVLATAPTGIARLFHDAIPPQPSPSMRIPNWIIISIFPSCGVDDVPNELMAVSQIRKRRSSVPQPAQAGEYNTLVVGIHLLVANVALACAATAVMPAAPIEDVEAVYVKALRVGHVALLEPVVGFHRIVEVANVVGSGWRDTLVCCGCAGAEGRGIVVAREIEIHSYTRGYEKLICDGVFVRRKIGGPDHTAAAE